LFIDHSPYSKKVSGKEIIVLYWAGFLFVFSGGSNRRIASHVIVATSLKEDKKTSKIE